MSEAKNLLSILNLMYIIKVAAKILLKFIQYYSGTLSHVCYFLLILHFILLTIESNI